MAMAMRAAAARGRQARRSLGVMAVVGPVRTLENAENYVKIDIPGHGFLYYAVHRKKLAAHCTDL